MKKFRFREFPVYKETLLFRNEIKVLITKFPSDEKFSLTSQLFRALNSVVLNIAEGADRGTDKDFAHFLNNAHTSLNEVVACLGIALNDHNISEKEHEDSLIKANLLANQITAFRRRLLTIPTK